MLPIKLSGRSEKLALVAGTAAIAAGVGFFLQSGTPLEAAAVQPEKIKKIEVPGEASVQVASSIGLNGQLLPRIPSEPTAVFPALPAALKVTQDDPISAMPSEEPAPMLGCEMEMIAETTIAALVDLTIQATCLPDARIVISHEGLRFHEVLDADGTLAITVPAFDEFAEFKVELPNGAFMSAETTVSSIVFYDRVAVQWLGETGLQIHAREFDADYGEAGHIWYGEPRDVTAVVGGDGGFLMRLGSGDSEISRTADVYTFPIGNPSRAGQVALSVEAEVNGANCGHHIAADTMQVHAGGDTFTNQFEIAMPDCGATGDFLVLKNLLEDLTIALQ